MNNKFLLKGGSVVNADKGSKKGKKGAESIESTVQDIRIANGLIAEVGNNLSANEDEQVIDVSGLHVCPGFIDVHTHLRDFEQTSAEDIESGTRAAAAGGFTTVTAMANTNPVIDNPLILQRLLQLIEKKSCVRVLPVASVTMNLAGQELTNMTELAELGAVAFSDDGQPVTNLALLKRALQNAKLLNRIIISHPEDKHLSAGGALNESGACARLGLPGIPAASEAACVAREIEIVRATGAHLHFAHISTAAAVNLIRRAKEDGLPVTADVTPHHLTLTDADIKTFDTSMKMNPPLRSTRDREAVIAGIADGTIDAVGTDHAPHSATDKRRTFADAPFGVIGLETAFSLLYDRLVLAGHIPFDKLMALLTTKPAAIMQLPSPKIQANEVADLAIIDLKKEWKYDTAEAFSRSYNSPFQGFTFSSKVVMTIARGSIAYQESKPASENESNEASSNSTASSSSSGANTDPNATSADAKSATADTKAQKATDKNILLNSK
jgi:dihydroorotase